MNKWKKNSKKFFPIFRDPRENYEVKRQQNGQTYFYGDKRQALDRVFLLFILVKLCLQSFRQFFFLLAPLFVLGSPSMGTNQYFLSLGVYKLIKAALFVWGAVKWRYYTVLPDIVIVISEQDNLRCTWLTELSKGNWTKPAQSRFI